MDRLIKRRRADYRLRKQIVGSAFSITNHVMNFQQIFMRELKLVGGEWNLADLECNMKQMTIFVAPPCSFKGQFDSFARNVFTFLQGRCWYVRDRKDLSAHPSSYTTAPTLVF
jgi:hypothetical protein